MDSKVKDFIELNADLIKQNDFERLYEEGLKDEEFNNIGKFTEAFLEMGIDPTSYMEIMPNGYLIGTEIESYTVPGNVRSVGCESFYGCHNLKSIKFPKNLNGIGMFAFHGTSLTDVEIPGTCSVIGHHAFSNCDKLTSVTIRGGKFDFEWGNQILEGAFENCSSLTSITISDSVKYIGNYVFRNCPNLKSINYLGTWDQWKRITMDARWKTGSCIEEIRLKDGIMWLKKDRRRKEGPLTEEID